MSRFSKPCGNYRESLCLLASGALPREERPLLESHLATCAGCRSYRDEIAVMAGPLVDWERKFAGVEPTESMQARWDRDFAAATEPKRPTMTTRFDWLLDWGKDLVWPSRRIWTGLAAIWLVVLIVNFSLRGPAQSQAMKSSRPSPEMVRAFLEREGLVARSREERVAEPPRPSPPPRS